MTTSDQPTAIIVVSGRCTAPCTDHVKSTRRSPQVNTPTIGIGGEDSGESNVLTAVR